MIDIWIGVKKCWANHSDAW